MKRVWIVSAILSFMCVAVGFSQESAPSVTPLSAEELAAIFDQPTGTGCPAPQGGVDLPGQHPSINMTCSATATCNDTSGVNVSCNWGGSGGSCTFQNQNCASWIRGQVNCNGTVTPCPPCPCGSTVCCTCAATESCTACCLCEGGTARQCSEECAGM